MSASQTSVLVVLFLDDGGLGSYRGGAGAVTVGAVAVGAVAVGDLDPLVLVGRFAVGFDVSVPRGVTDAGHMHTSGEVDRRYLPTRPY